LLAIVYIILMARSNQNKKIPGTPPITDQEFNTIITDIAMGSGLLKACRNAHVSTDSFYDYINIVGDLAAARYVQAKEKQIEALLDSMDHVHEECMSAVESVDDPKRANAIVQAYRLRIDDYKWRASKLKPKKYGDRLEIASDQSIQRIQIVPPTTDKK
jgi:hypothetical protein